MTLKKHLDIYKEKPNVNKKTRKLFKTNCLGWWNAVHDESRNAGRCATPVRCPDPWGSSGRSFQWYATDSPVWPYDESSGTKYYQLRGYFMTKYSFVRLYFLV